MTRVRNEDWSRPRGRGNGVPLNEAQLNLITKRFMDKVPLEQVAMELGCSTRTIAKYYGRLRTAGTFQIRERPQPPAPAKPKAPLPSRFYKPNFEL